jgi:hypothetical protein
MSLFSRPEKIRKQVYELTAADLEHAAVWEFCLDEEGEPDQDEATVKPRADLRKIEDLNGSLVAKTEFTFADGKKAVGCVYATSEPGLPAIQPVIITPRGRVMFWYGVMQPDEKTVAGALATLATICDKPFPIRFSCVVPTKGISIEGNIEGFYHYDRKHEIQVIKK